MRIKYPYKSRFNFGGVKAYKPGAEPETGTRTPSKSPFSMTHREIFAFGRWEMVVPLEVGNDGTILDPTSVRSKPQEPDYNI